MTILLQIVLLKTPRKTYRIELERVNEFYLKNKNHTFWNNPVVLRKAGIPQTRYSSNVTPNRWEHYEKHSIGYPLVTNALIQLIFAEKWTLKLQGMLLTYYIVYIPPDSSPISSHSRWDSVHRNPKRTCRCLPLWSRSNSRFPWVTALRSTRIGLHSHLRPQRRVCECKERMAC